jgi:hypothetical protein
VGIVGDNSRRGLVLGSLGVSARLHLRNSEVEGNTDSTVEVEAGAARIVAGPEGLGERCQSIWLEHEHWQGLQRSCDPPRC